jgi:hypothetical protein
LPEQVFEITLYDCLGRVVLREPYTSGTIEVNCSDFPKGMYFLLIEDGINTYSQKVIIKNGL